MGTKRAVATCAVACKWLLLSRRSSPSLTTLPIVETNRAAATYAAASKWLLVVCFFLAAHRLLLLFSSLGERNALWRRVLQLASGDSRSVCCLLATNLFFFFSRSDETRYGDVYYSGYVPRGMVPSRH